jgi:small subunit ribosomal protein S3
MLAEDIKVREYLKTKLKNAAVSRVLIERPAKNARITIFSARPGVVIGKKGEDIEKLKKELASRWACRSPSTSRKCASPKSMPS